MMRNWRHFDFILFGAVIVLIVIGLAFVRSATQGVPSLEDLFSRQIIYAVVGLVLVILIALVDYRLLGTLQWTVYLLILVMLAALFAYGQISGGARSWLGQGAVQPSELAKILLIVTLGQYLALRQEQIRRLPVVIVSLVYAIIPAVLIYLQPDLGTAVVIMVMWLAMVWAAGVRPVHLALFAALAVVALPFLWLVLEDYMRQRLLLFFNPGQDPAARYNIEQALISIGSGGWLGKGLGAGSQSQLHFLRVRHTDFIFSVIAEESGFVGAVIVLALEAFIIFRILRAAQLARDPLGRLICVGVATIIFFQTLVNVGMNLNLLPVTGLTLPFISYGGSSLIALLVGIGLVESVVMRHKKIGF
ncbi:MAG: rod shape-determining protein RodA [Chloroflexota bacterium]